MQILTLLLFLIYTYGLGFTATSFFKNSENFLERNLMRLGIGLGVFIVLGVILNLLHIPLDWRIFLAISIIYPLFALTKKIKNKEFNPSFNLKITKENINILIVLLIFLICCNMYIGGAFKYPYLEDDDPWQHALGVKYISLEKTAYGKENFNFQYFDPYPPGYDMLMGVLHQTNDSVSWTLKFFNGLIISLGIIFFYFFSKLFMEDRRKALFATFVIASLPSFFTHFIWAHSLVIVLFFPTMYCLEMIKLDKKWIYVSMILLSSIILTQPTKAIKLLIMVGIYWLIKSILERNINKEIIYSLLGSFVISLTWWATRWKSFFLSQTSQSLGTKSSGLIAKILSAFPPESGTATRAYTLSDFLFAQPFGGINIHVGWGIVASILLLLGLVYAFITYKESFKKEKAWIPITLLWFLFTFLGTNSMTFNLPIGLYAFRFWLLLAIPVALLCSLGLWFLFEVGKKAGIPKIIILVVVVAGILATSSYQKYNQNHNAIWPPGVAWGSNEEIQGYIGLSNLPKNTRIFGICSEESSSHIIGFDMMDEVWKDSIIAFKKEAINLTSEKISSFLKKENYSYLIIDSRCVEYFGGNKTNEFVNELTSSKLFTPQYQTQGMIVFKVL